MAQLTAGDTITFDIEGNAVTVKIEDASKSESFLAKIIDSSHADYQPDQVHDFPRSLLS